MKVGRYIEDHKKELVELTKELVRIPTVNPPGENYEKIVSVLEKRCRRLRLKTRRIETPKDELRRQGISSGSRRINLLAGWDVGSNRLLHINGHYDVVPTTSRWKTQPFKPVVKGGRIYGRGTVDMKANIASTLMAIESLKANNIKPNCNIELSFTPDEETGGRSGFGYLVKKGIVKPDYAVCEGYHDNFLSYGNKGLIWFKIEVDGKSCHSSEPYNGINSFEKMIAVADELMKLQKRIARRKTAFKTKKEIDRHPTMMMGGELYGGHKTNIVPDRSVFTIDRRLLPEEDLEDAKNEVIQAIERLKKKDRDLVVKVNILSEERPAVSNERNILFKVFSRSIKKILNKKGRCALLAGATDIRFLIRKGVACLGYSPDGGNSCHCDDEYVKIRSLIDTAKIFADAIANLK